MVKVFFNNSCNICRTEINLYKKHCDDSIKWVDVTDNQEAQKATSRSYRDLLRRMHVIQDGKVIDGAESFLIIWKNIPKYNFLYKIFKKKPLFFFLNIFYEIAAYLLFIKNKYLLDKFFDFCREYQQEISPQKMAEILREYADRLDK